MDILLVAVLLIFAGFGLHGYLRGLVRVVFSLVAVFLAIGLATALSPHVTHFLQEQTPLHDTIKGKCTEYLQSTVKGEIGQRAQSQEKIYVFGMRVPDEVQEILGEQAAGQADSIMENAGVYDKIGNFVAEQVIQRLAWVLSFVLILILLAVAVHFLDIIARLPVLENINRIGGLAVGLLEGLVVVWIVLLVIVLCQGTEFGRELMTSIEGNFFLKALHENNLLEQLIMG